MRLPQPRESFRRPPRGFYQRNTGEGDWNGKGNRCSNQLLTNWNRRVPCQGMTSVMPQAQQNQYGFSRRGHVFRAITLAPETSAFEFGTTPSPNFRSSVPNRCFIVGGGAALYPRHSSLFRRSEVADEVPNSSVAPNSWRGRHRVVRDAEASQS